MIETFFFRSQVCARLKSGPLGPYLPTLTTDLQALGYSIDGIRRHVRYGDAFTRWLAQKGLSVADANEATVRRYVTSLGRNSDASRLQGRLPNAAVGLGQVLKVLRHHGIVAPKAEAVASTEAEHWLTSFDQHLECVIGASPGTRRHYLRYAGLLIESRFGLATPDWRMLSAEDVADFVRREAGKLESSSCRMPVAATKAFLRFLVFRGAIGAGLIGAVPPIRQWKQASLPMPLSDGDLAQLIATGEEHTPTRYRDHAVLMLLVGLGLRANEVVNLRLDDIHWVEGRILIHAGKTHRERSLPLFRDIGKSIVEYLKRERPASIERRLFLRAQPPLGPLETSGAITGIVKSLWKRAGICRPHSGAHVLRHTAATKMLCAGAAFKEIADILGHQSLHSTAIYAKLDVESLAGVAMPWPGGAP